VSRALGIAAAAALLAAGPATAAPGLMRVFIASDSTAQDYGQERYPQQGWGMMLRCAFDDGVAVDNHAMAARSSRSFIAEGRLDDIARDIRAGDTLLIQFGHNDANREKPERYAPVADYRAYLRRYIDVARRAGAKPVLLTPVTRRNFVGGHVAPSFPEYSQAVREVAAETGAPLIDLDALSGQMVERAGAEGSRAYFLPDDTHFSELGARRMADLVAAALAGLSLPVSAHVLHERPALTRASSAGDASCAAPAAVSPRSFRFAGQAQPGETVVDARRRYRDGYGFEAGSTPIFSVAAPPGNYRVTLTLGGGAASVTTVKAESRRLMLQDVRSAPGRTAERSFVVNVRDAALAPPPPNAPGATAVRLHPREADSFTWDDRLTLEFLGPAPAVRAVRIEPVDATTVFLFGDSTVTDQRWEPNASWGQMLPRFLGPQVAVANYAESGETLKSFIAELRLDKALSLMRPGDYALIQFGHNDQKAQWPQTYAAGGSIFASYLRAMIAEVRLRGATPVLVTPPERRTFTAEGRIRPTLADYAQAMRAVAEEEKVALIDLNATSVRLYQALGPQAAGLAFADGGRDATHHDAYGAYLLARAVAEGLRASGPPLAADLPPFDPDHPPAPAEVSLPASGNPPAPR